MRAKTGECPCCDKRAETFGGTMECGPVGLANFVCLAPTEPRRGLAHAPSALFGREMAETARNGRFGWLGLQAKRTDGVANQDTATWPLGQVATMTWHWLAWGPGWSGWVETNPVFTRDVATQFFRLKIIYPPATCLQPNLQRILEGNRPGSEGNGQPLEERCTVSRSVTAPAMECMQGVPRHHAITLATWPATSSLYAKNKRACSAQIRAEACNEYNIHLLLLSILILLMINHL